MKPIQRLLSIPAVGIIVILLYAGAAAFAATEQVFVVTSDYETGGYAVFSPGSTTAHTRAGTIFQDAVARSFGNRLYVIERWHGDNILIFDQSNLDDPVMQFSVGSGSNPHDFLLLSETKAYVTLYERSGLLIVDPSSGRITGTIDLSAFADGDGIPEMDQLLYCHNRIFVSLQRLDRNNLFQPAGLSQIVIIDPETDAIVDARPAQPGIQAIDLFFTNPIDMQYISETDKIIVAGAGSFYNVGDGGLEWIDPNALRTEGQIMSESEIGGQLGGAFGTLHMRSSSEGYAIIMTEDWLESRVIRFNLKERSTKPIHAPANGFIHADVLTIGERLYICDRTIQNPGIRIFDTTTDREITTEPIATGLPPFCLTRIGPDTTVIPDPTNTDNQTMPAETACYVTALVSPSPIPFYTDVFVFYQDGSLTLKKLEQYGTGEYYMFGPNLFYFIFNSGAAVADIRFVQGSGMFLNGLNRNRIIGFGTIMVDYELLPFAFFGREVFKNATGPL